MLRRSLPRGRLRVLRAAARLARDLDMPAYLIGGSVRDLLAGSPSCDLDLCVVGDGISFAHALARGLHAPVAEEPRFLTAKITLPGGAVDVATSRRETYPRPGALPRVTPGRIEDDLARRDFTVNAMALPLDQRLSSPLLDPFSGRDDLARRQLRVLHDRSFIDDPTRLLRAARYAARLGFRLETATRRLAIQAVRADSLGTVSGDRIRRELLLLLDERRAAAGIELCARLGLLGALHPAIAVGRRAYAALGRCDALCRWFPQRAAGAHLDCGLARLLVIADGLSPREGAALSRRLSLTARQHHALASYLTAAVRARRVLSAAAARNSIVARTLEVLPLEAVAALAATSSPAVARRCRLFLGRLRGVRARIRGEDLAHLGLEPGPAWGRALAAARGARLDGRARTKGDELRIAAAILRRHAARGRVL